MEKRIDVNPGDNTINQLEKLNNELLEIRSNKLKGHQIRSRYQHYKDWEKPSKYFFNLEKKNYLNKNISELITNNNQIINDSKSILKEQASFYWDLFSTKGNKIDEQTRYSHLLDNLPKITATNKHKLEESIKLIELEDSIKTSKTSKTNKAPGPDGFSNELFKVFSHELKYWILRLFNESLLLGKLPDTILEGIITCIPKTGKERNSLKKTGDL